MLCLKFFAIILIIGCYAEEYATNFRANLKWENNTVKYVVSNTRGTKQDLQKLVNETLAKFTLTFGNHIRWEEVVLCEKVLSTLERYLIFTNFEIVHHEICGFSTTMVKGPSVIELPFEYDNGQTCTDSDRFYHLLWILGFTPTHWRHDRENFITIEWDNIRSSDKAFYQKRFDLLNSANEAFRTYDPCSLLHPPALSLWGNNSTSPVLTPRDRSKLECMVERGLRNATKSDVAQFRAIYR